MVETTIWPETVAQWLAIAALGVGPVGAAFYAWDIGMKRGDIRVLGCGILRDAAALDRVSDPGGLCQAERQLAIAAVLIAGGGLIAAKDMFAETPLS